MNSDHFNAAVDFGRDLIKTQDLDPVYTAIYAAQLPYKLRARVLVAYTCIYHLGAAVKLAQAKDFWVGLQTAATNEGLVWPRGSERRHWRGANAQATVDYLRARYATPESLVAYWAAGDTRFPAVAARVEEIPSYGPWISFKTCDMLERVMGHRVDFTDGCLGIYEEPRKGAALLLTGDAETKISSDDVEGVVKALLKALGKLKAPPSLDRVINVQCAETILCKYKSGVFGHYPRGKDTREVLHGLRAPKWECPVVRKMIKALEELPYARSDGGGK